MREGCGRGRKGKGRGGGKPSGEAGGSRRGGRMEDVQGAESGPGADSERPNNKSPDFEKRRPT